MKLVLSNGFIYRGKILREDSFEIIFDDFKEGVVKINPAQVCSRHEGDAHE